jgi:hypothetical protein
MKKTSTFVTQGRIHTQHIYNDRLSVIELVEHINNIYITSIGPVLHSTKKYSMIIKQNLIAINVPYLFI